MQAAIANALEYAAPSYTTSELRAVESVLTKLMAAVAADGINLETEVLQKERGPGVANLYRLFQIVSATTSYLNMADSELIIEMFSIAILNGYERSNATYLPRVALAKAIGGSTQNKTTAESKNLYVVKCERQIDRVGLTFQFEHNGEVTWWHRRQDFEEQDGEAAMWWMKAAAESYEHCAARLVGATDVAANAVPIITMGDLRIETDPKDGMTHIELSYHNYGMRKATLEAHYSYKIPSAKLAAAFIEAAAAIREAEK